MMQIPVAAKPAQTLNVVLAGQVCKINLYQKSTGLFLDLFVNNVAIVQAAVCLDRVNTIRRAYLGFIGGLVICDTQGVTDPVYSGLGSRYVLIYLEAADMV